MARPTKYTEERIAAICDDLRKGASRRDAAEHNGISYDALNEWEKRYASFASRLARAEADCATSMAERMTIHALTDWHAAESWLKRRRRDDWGDRTSVEHSGTIGTAPIREVVVERPPEVPDAELV
jgi:hypothetical protein